MRGLDLIRHRAESTIVIVRAFRAAGGCAIVSLVAAAVGCSTSAPEGVTLLSIADPRNHWANEGFVQLVPGVHMPSSDHQTDQVEIWAKLPEGGVITEQAPTDDGAPVGMLFPRGSVLERVEFAFGGGGRRFMVDVRGTRIAADGRQHFHVYRRGDAGLFGFEWARQDTAAHARATDALVKRLATHAPAKAMDETRQAAFLASVRTKNACADCHAISRVTNTTQKEHGLVNRGTDASGFFTPWTVFADPSPLEFYGGHDRTESDRFSTISCPASATLGQDDRGRATCTGSVVPLGHFDLVEAMAAKDPRALQICSGRRYLAEHFSPELRQRFAPYLVQCDDGT